MGFFKSLKGKQPDFVGGESSSQGQGSSGRYNDGQYQPPPGPPPSQDQKQQHGGYMPPPGPPPTYQPPQYGAPAGQFPSYQSSQYAPPPGPPPSHQSAQYAPPPGPPPSHASSSAEPPPYHDWTVIPDTALLPPPPSFGHAFSPTGNADEDEAIRAVQWCDHFPLMQPRQPYQEHLAAVRNGQISLQRPQEFQGSLNEVSTGSWRGSSKARSKDSCLLTALPLYFAAAESPLLTEVPKTVYFEVKILAFGPQRTEDANSLAIGFCAVPFPTWRQPGWQRGSVGVHSDDGRRFLNNTDGGIDFTSPFLAGETIGLGITYAVSRGSGPPLQADVFLTRNGTRTDGWNLHEELDAEVDAGVFGVDGNFDLFGGIGTFGEVSFEVHFNRRDWLWQPN